MTRPARPGPRVDPRLANLLIWVAAGAVGAWIALRWLPATVVDGEFVPIGPDAFYHARRILDTHLDPGAFYQFDPLVHAPLGSWVPVPWGYDLAAAWLLRVVTAVLPDASPGPLLALLPVFWVFVNAGLLLGVTSALGLSPALRAVALACFAVSPLTQYLHGAGQVDHHFVELTMVLGTLWLGLRSAAGTAGGASALAWGALLGLAPAVHSALFILQIPVLAWALIAWLRRCPPAPALLLHLAVGLLAGTVLAVAPSEPARAGVFSFHLLSWFQAYVACCTALLLLLTARLAPGARSLGVVLVVGLLLALPLAENIVTVNRFMSRDYAALDGLLEMTSVWAQATDGGTGWLVVLSTYSVLIVVFPAVLAALAWRALVTADRRELLFCLSALLGGILMLLQLRLHYLGSFAVYLPPLLALQHLGTRFPRRRTVLHASAGVLFAGALAPGLAMLDAPRVGGGLYYELVRGVFPPLAEACADAPGVLLADFRDGHFLRYHTRCAVVGNMFGLTPADHRMIRRTEALMGRSAAEIRDHEPWIRYVLVVREDNVLDPPAQAEILRLNAGIRGDLLFASEPWPAGYELVGQVVYRYPDSGAVTVVARAFRIVR